MKVGIIGYGVVGSALGKACIAKGIDIYVYDKWQAKHALLSNILPTDIVFMCVPTPTVNNKQDDSAIEENLMELTKEKYTGTVVLRSTLVPGSTENFRVRFPDLHLVHCPEFLTAAFPVEDLFKQQVVLLGSSDPSALLIAHRFWTIFDPRIPILDYSSGTATEMAKYMSNCFLATKVSFMNEMFAACLAANVDYDDVRDAAVAVGYVGAGHTKVPGPDGSFGFGGMCFIKDTTALMGWMKAQGLPCEVLEAITVANRRVRPQAYNGVEKTGYSE